MIHRDYSYDPGAELGVSSISSQFTIELRASSINRQFTIELRASSISRQFTIELLLPPVSHLLLHLPRDVSVLTVIKRIMYSVKKNV